MMQLAYHVAMGIPLWDYPVRQGTVLYLALEDDYPRLQGRLMQMFGVESTDNLILTTQSKTLAEGLPEQMERFMQRHPDTSLVIVDTLQKVREIGNESYSYAMDYKNTTTTNYLKVEAKTGTKVFSVMDGTVKSVSGGVVTIKNDSGYTVKFSGLKSISVSAGEEVTSGQLVGKVGSTGTLKIYLSYNGAYLNPYFYLETG